MAQGVRGDLVDSRSSGDATDDPAGDLPVQGFGDSEPVEREQRDQGVIAGTSEARGTEHGTSTVTGPGDIAPAAGDQITGAGTVEQSLVGTMFITAEYRRGLIHTTLALAVGTVLRRRPGAATAVIAALAVWSDK